MLVLKLPRFFPCQHGKRKSAAISRIAYFLLKFLYCFSFSLYSIESNKMYLVLFVIQAAKISTWCHISSSIRISNESDSREYQTRCKDYTCVRLYTAFIYYYQNTNLDNVLFSELLLNKTLSNILLTTIQKVTIKHIQRSTMVCYKLKRYDHFYDRSVNFLC